MRIGTPHSGMAGRRRFLFVAGATVFLPSHGYAAADDARLQDDQITQPVGANKADFIGLAFDLQKQAADAGDQAYGAVIVRDGLVIGQSGSRVILDQDPTGHAEMSAIRDAARRLGSRHLSNAILYSSSRPCPMCEAAAYWAGIKQMIHGRSITDAGQPGLC